ncbi:signal peptidase I [Cohnella sp. CFH 77786]|uniref:signal peptidase I n=1 Tax=Cohnella sp. CFH 77786 TaxID=2662265 RepID=UPI001C60EB09|nr:signal peptidase I [Cohnella sp. CFH 77786]MBW5444598.1 signal peptidase I [Cohnella sp. CFH 77786]
MEERRNPDIVGTESENGRAAIPASGVRAENGEREPHGGGTSENGGNPDKPEPPSKAAGELVEWIKALAVAGLLVFVIRWFLVSPFIVDGPSMQPNFHDRERIIVNKIIYDIRQPKRGEVIVFHVPEEGRDFIKRVIAVPGDTVKVEGDTITINGKPIDEPYLKEAYEKAHASGGLYNPNDMEWSNFPNNRYPDGKVPEGTLFVMGDNRSNSEDSRMIGYIPMDRVVGRADLVYWPLADFHFITH